MDYVVNIKSGKPYDVYIGRPSKWGNPFQIGVDGDRTEVIEKYRERMLTVDWFVDEVIYYLRGKVLGCYCKPAACHGDLLAEIANSMTDKEFEDFIANVKPFHKGWK